MTNGSKKLWNCFSGSHQLGGTVPIKNTSGYGTLMKNVCSQGDSSNLTPAADLLSGLGVRMCCLNSNPVFISGYSVVTSPVYNCVCGVSRQLTGACDSAQRVQQP